MGTERLDELRQRAALLCVTRQDLDVVLAPYENVQLWQTVPRFVIEKAMLREELRSQIKYVRQQIHVALLTHWATLEDFK